MRLYEPRCACRRRLAAGRFPEAAATAREAAAVAAAQGDKEMVGSIGKQVEAYQAGQPYREAGQ